MEQHFFNWNIFNISNLTANLVNFDHENIYKEPNM